MRNPFADSRCKILTKYFGVGLCRNKNYIVNIIERLSRSGGDDNGISISGVTVKRQKRRRNVPNLYPYGLNDISIVMDKHNYGKCQ